MSQMSAIEFDEWQAFYNIDPFGDQRADVRMAILASAVVAPYIEKGKTVPKLAEFMPFSDEVIEPTSIERPAQCKEIPLEGKVGAAVAKRMFKHMQGKTKDAKPLQDQQ